MGGWLADRLILVGWGETRARKAVITVGFVAGLLLIPALLVTRRPVFICFLMGASLVGFAQGNFWAILQSFAATSRVGLWTGSVNSLGNLGGAVAPLALGILISRTHSYTPGLCVAAIIQALGVIPLWMVITNTSRDGWSKH